MPRLIFAPPRRQTMLAARLTSTSGGANRTIGTSASRWRRNARNSRGHRPAHVVSSRHWCRFLATIRRSLATRMGSYGGCRMNEELIWKVRDEADGRGSRQKAPPKACFYWKRDGQLVRSAEFTQSELEVEIERLNADVAQFVIALNMLALSRGSLAR